MGTGYRARAGRLVEALRSSPGIRVTKAEVAPPASEEALATALGYASYRLPEGVEDFYREVGALEIAWETLEAYDGAVERGSVNLLPVERIFANWEGAVWFSGAGHERFKEVKPFDLFVSEACAAFVQRERNVPSDEVSFHVFGEATCATGRNFNEYLDLLFISRGYLYWQTAISTETSGSDEAQRALRRVRELFPGTDASALHPG